MSWLVPGTRRVLSERAGLHVEHGRSKHQFVEPGTRLLHRTHERRRVVRERGVNLRGPPLPMTCAPPKGLLFNAPFEVTGGTGAFAGATGGGKEFSSTGNPSPIIYIGTIMF